jgi:spore maturation protein CgeB
MDTPPLKIVFLGLSISSSWGNGHATTYRALIKALHARGHSALFLERDLYWYRENRDLPEPPYATVEYYDSVAELESRFATAVRDADAVIVGSFVPDGIAVGEWVTSTATGVTAFYDIDTPVTLAKLESGDIDYLSESLVPRYDLYLSFTGGPTLNVLEQRYGAQTARALYCSVDPAIYYVKPQPVKWDLGYLGTYSEDRLPQLEALLIEPARRMSGARMMVAGPMYPPDFAWPPNVEREIHLAPREHCDFYNRQRYTLNITRADMRRAGFSPSVRLFEAAACGTPIVSDWWPGIDTFFEPGREILIARSTGDVLRFLRDLPDSERQSIGSRARARVLSRHTADHRARELEGYLQEASNRTRCSAGVLTGDFPAV